jgi:hypothetical protein
MSIYSFMFSCVLCFFFDLHDLLVVVAAVIVVVVVASVSRYVCPFRIPAA